MKRWGRFMRRKLVVFWRDARHALVAINPLRAAGDAAILLVALQLTILGINWVNNNNPILGLRFGGHLIGQLGSGDFKKEADAIVRNYETKTISIQVAEETSVITLRQLGVDIDEAQVHATLLAQGRTGSPLARLIDQDLAPLGVRNVPLESANFNVGLAQEYIAWLNQKIDIPPENAYFAFENNQAVIRADKHGRSIDTEAAIAVLRQANPTKDAQVVLPTKQVSAAVTEPMLSPLLPEVQAIAQKPLTIAAGDSRTTLSPEQLVALVVPKVISDPHDATKTIVQITFDEAKLKAIVDEVVGRAVVAPKPTIMSGKQVVQQGSSGRRAEDGQTLSRVLAALVERQTGAGAPDEAQIPLITVDPPVVQQVVNNPRTRTGTGLVRLTFDDGPGGYTDQILDILKRYNVHATFYVVGRNVPHYAGQMQRTKNEGHKICNHSFSHANLAHLSSAGVRQELSSTQAAIQQTTGVTPDCFRPPYGAQNATVREVAANLGLSVDMWSVDPRDWANPGSGAITRRVLDGTGPGAVVLLHVLNQQTVNALPAIIEGIRAQGFTLE